MSLELVIANKRYSSWSLRAWLVLSCNELAFVERRVDLQDPTYKETLRTLAIAAQVPILRHEDLIVFDSLAICEYLAENFALTHGWPQDHRLRAQARSFCAMMHSGYTALRRECPMNVARQPTLTTISADARADIATLEQALGGLLRTHGGPFLLGPLGIIDAYYAPIMLRLDRYGLSSDLSSELRAYMARMLALPAMQAWVEAGRQEAPLARLER